MKDLEKMYSDDVVGGVAYSDGVQKTGLEYVLEKNNRGKTSWASFLIRNDFGIFSEKHEVVGKLPMFMRML